MNTHKIKKILQRKCSGEPPKVKNWRIVEKFHMGGGLPLTKNETQLKTEQGQPEMEQGVRASKKKPRGEAGSLTWENFPHFPVFLGGSVPF